MHSSIVEFERKYVNAEVEHGLFLLKDGSTMQVGGDSPIGIDIEEEWYLTCRHAILTHNHPVIPGSKNGSNVLSINDINAAISLNLKQIRAVRFDRIALMHRPKDGWGVEHISLDMRNYAFHHMLAGTTVDDVNKYLDLFVPDAEMEFEPPPQ